MKSVVMSFESKVNVFKDWCLHQKLEGQLLGYRDWESEYEHWQEIVQSFNELLEKTIPSTWIDSTWDALIFAVARDLISETLMDVISEDTELFLLFSDRASRSEEADAKWQCAAQTEYMGTCSVHKELLRKLTDDPDEYVSRRALNALSKTNHKDIEPLAVRAWSTGHEYQRISALHALNLISSDLLTEYLLVASESRTKQLFFNAICIEFYRSTLQLLNGSLAIETWHRTFVTHYKDERLEAYRCAVVRLLRPIPFGSVLNGETREELRKLYGKSIQTWTKQPL